jgi:hypothetical protein
MNGKRGDADRWKWWYIPVASITSCDLMIHEAAYLIGESCSKRLGFTSKRSITIVRTSASFILGLIMLPLLILNTLYRRSGLILRKSRVSGTPGSFLCRLADFLCSKKTKQEIADPIISDMQFEYYDALFAHRKAKAAWIRVRGCCAFFHALGLHRILKGIAGLFQQARPR